MHVNFIFEVWMQARSSANETGKQALHSNWMKCNLNRERVWIKEKSNWMAGAGCHTFHG